MSRAKKTARGAPMASRERRGYAIDLEHLARLRRAAFNDGRLTVLQYQKIADATFTIENVLRPLAKGR